MSTNLQTVEELADQLSLADQQLLLQRLRHKLLHTPPQNPRSLAGLWKDAFPPDFDIDAALKEIRSEWLQELDEFGL